MVFKPHIFIINNFGKRMDRCDIDMLLTRVNFNRLQ